MSQNTEIDPVYNEQIGHGNSIAAWALVGIMLVGSVVAGIAFANLAWSIFWVGCGIMALGLVVGFILKLAGFGVGGARSGASH
ncbi:HGxxPAAW family protein [Glutamicibacter sp.]|uniref:HGxxPAAW family protein n=1 Tax=Glutamicibacter sp. TaxID=1931995 RepID=UPI0028BD2243|nr:HGxxPAAW family protein [Glutamicibacter sp.]